MDAEKLLFSLIRIVICGEKPEEGLQADCTPEKLEAVYALALRHDLAHLVGQAVSQLKLPESETVQKCKQAAMSAFLRYVRLNQAYTQACNALASAGIPFIPLKGSVLRNDYPDAWMRTSSDIDILVREEDLQKATELFTQQWGYRFHKKTSHDVSMFSAEGVHLELHYSTIEDFISPKAHAIMADVWSCATATGEDRYLLQMPDDLFYYYHIAHMAKHFVNGGCGIRTVLDLWILRYRIPYDGEAREKLLQRGGMLPFARAAEGLCDYWFCHGSADELIRSMEQFILRGGTFGNLENQVLLNQSRKGGKLRHAISKIFLPYHIIQYHYPVLQKHKALLPVCQLARWCKLLFRGGAKRSLRELQVNASLSREAGMTAQMLLEQLGLQ